MAAAGFTADPGVETAGPAFLARGVCDDCAVGRVVGVWRFLFDGTGVMALGELADELLSVGAVSLFCTG